MWLFTKYAFFSAVYARPDDGGHDQPVDPSRIMVRARLGPHLEALKDRFPDLLSGCDIKEFPGTDYALRIFVDKAVWTRRIAGISDELDYDNFKSEVARFQGQHGADYAHSLHEVWSVTYRLRK